LTINKIIERVHLFEDEAHSILGRHETAPSRLVVLDQTYNRLSGLSLIQDELFRESLRCIEHGLFRAAHVLAWAGFIDFLENKVATEAWSKLLACRPNWKASNLETLREIVPEYQLIESFADVGLYGKTVKKAILGLLNKRNECGHPSDYFPELNETLGFVSELLQRIGKFQTKVI